MKQYVFSPIDGSFMVSYLTNAIGAVGDTDRQFINEIKSKVGAGNWVPGLCSEGQALGLYDDYTEITHKQLVSKAVDLEMNLQIFADGAAVVNMNETLALFLTYSIPNATVVIDHTAETIEISMKQGTVVTALVATFTTSNESTVKIGATAQVSGTTTNNFSAPKTYRITAKDGDTTKDYVATVTLRLARFATFDIPTSTVNTIDHNAKTVSITVPALTVVTALVAEFTTINGAIAKVGETTQVSEVTENDFTNPVVYRVNIVDDATYNDYTVTVTVSA